MDAVREVSAPEVWCWGTSAVYPGRVHVVHPDHPEGTLCRLPVERFSDVRPHSPERLCPECCIEAIALTYPRNADESMAPVPAAPARFDDPAAVTVQLPVIHDHEP